MRMSERQPELHIELYEYVEEKKKEEKKEERVIVIDMVEDDDNSIDI